MRQHDKDAIAAGTEKEIDPGHIVSFKGDFLGKLVDAVALIEVLEITLRHHEDIDYSKTGFMGMSMLVEQIKGLLDINANLLPDDIVAPNATPLRRLDR